MTFILIILALLVISLVILICEGAHAIREDDEL